MRLLLINPNTSAETTDRMARVARKAAPGVKIIAETAAFGASHIKTPEELETSKRAVMEIVNLRGQDVDAVIIGAFADPALGEVRAAVACPVIGIGQASFHAACLLGRPYGIASLTPGLAEPITALIESYGLGGLLAGIRGQDLAEPRGEDETVSVLAELIDDLVRNNGAETVIIAGGPLAGYHERLEGRVPARLLDPVTCAARFAVGLV